MLLKGHPVRYKCTTSFHFVSLNWLWAFDISQFYLYLPLFLESFGFMFPSQWKKKKGRAHTHPNHFTIQTEKKRKGGKKEYVWVKLNFNYKKWNFLLRRHNVSEDTRIDCSNTCVGTLRRRCCRRRRRFRCWHSRFQTKKWQIQFVKNTWG